MKLRRELLATIGLLLPLTLSAAPAVSTNLEDFRISYDALLANGDVEDAFQLARDVGRHNPDNQDWQRRLARVATWSAHPVEAYAAWKGLFKAGVRDKEVMGEVRRLATHFNDAPILIELAQEGSSPRNMSEKEAQALADHYERAYRPLVGARYFEQLYRKEHRKVQGEQAARLYRRAGKDADAVRIYRSLLARFPGNPEWTMDAARLEILRDRRTAFNLLKQQQSHMPANATEYWQLLGDLAWQFQDDATAKAAYRHAAVTPGASYSERDRLTYLLMEEDPLQAAAMAMRYYSNGAGSAWLVRAMEIQVAQNAWGQARQSLAKARSNEMGDLEENTRFLLLRAQISQHFGDSAGAVADMRAALSLAPDDEDVQLTALWVFIAANELEGLEAMVAATKAESDNPRYWQALATAYQTLGRSREALDFYRLRLKRSKDDPVLLLSYADLLQASGQTDMATRMRQRAWKRLQEMPGKVTGLRYLARVRTDLANRPGDGAAQRIRTLLTEGSDLTPERKHDLDELLMNWALENGQLDSVRAWSGQRFGDTRQLPSWAQLQLALASNDVQTLQRLLENEGENLPASNAHEAAIITGDWPLARQLAFNGAQRDPEDGDLHQRLVNTTIQNADYVGVSGEKAYYSDFDSTLYRLRADKAVNGQWRLAVDGHSAEQTLTTRTTLRTIPANDRSVTLEALGSTTQHDWRIALERHSELTDYLGWQLGYGQDIDRRLHLDLLFAGHQNTDHSTPLQVAGYADRATVTAAWASDRHLRFNAQFASERYHTQHGAYLGSGSQLNWEAAYSLRSAYPDWNVRITGSHYRFRPDGMPDNATLGLFTPQPLALTPAAKLATLFVPEDNDYYGVCGGAGQSLRDNYSSALRPLADACAIHNRDTGTGYSLLAGLSGSLVGEDQLTLLWELSHAGRQAGGRDVRVITLSYRLYF